MKDEAAFTVEVDRIEGDLAVLALSDDEPITFNLPLAYLPKGVRDGDHLRVSLKLDEESRAARKARVADLLKGLTGGGED